MKIWYAETNYGEREIQAVLNVLKNNSLSLMNGKNVCDLERKVANIFRKEYGVMTNSGSSANLLAIKSLRLPVGGKVITPALTFSTTVAPLVQCGLIPLFIDIELDTLQIDSKLLNKINLENVCAICVPNLIGNIANWEDIYSFAKENQLKIIEDSCDTLGYSYQTKLKDWSDVSTTSFYASHIITGAGFGGLLALNDSTTFELALSLRGWGRRSAKYSETEDYERRFDAVIDGFEYDDKYIFDDLGYNFSASEISAAFALVQLNNLEVNIKQRVFNFNYLRKELQFIDNFKVFSQYDNVKTGWLAFPLLLQGKMRGKRKKFQIFLENSGIQTRTIFTGNILRQPISKSFKWDSFGEFHVADKIMKDGVLLGCHNKMTIEKMDYMLEKIKEAEACLM